MRSLNKRNLQHYCIIDAKENHCINNIQTWNRRTRLPVLCLLLPCKPVGSVTRPLRQTEIRPRPVRHLHLLFTNAFQIGRVRFDCYDVLYAGPSTPWALCSTWTSASVRRGPQHHHAFESRIQEVRLVWRYCVQGHWIQLRLVRRLPRPSRNPSGWALADQLCHGAVAVGRVSIANCCCDGNLRIST
jgi:hypothetical protein